MKHEREKEGKEERKQKGREKKKRGRETFQTIRETHIKNRKSVKFWKFLNFLY